jgi:quinol monooxygenase YgiN
MSVIVVATLSPLPHRRGDVIAALEEAISRVHVEDEGCELYALHEGADRLVMIEKWASNTHLARHSDGDVLKRLGGRLEGALASPSEVQILHPHPAGNAEQGTL